MKNMDYRFKTQIRNQWLFLQKLASRNSFGSSFARDIYTLCAKHNGDDFFEIFKEVAGLKEFQHRSKYMEIVQEYIERVKDLDPSYLPDVKDFLHKHNLGNEWTETLFLLFATGQLLPPDLNIYIRADSGGSKNQTRVVLELNPDTSLEDIGAAWAHIKTLQKKLWPNFTSTNLTSKTKKNMELYIADSKHRTATKLDRKRLTDLDIVGQIYPIDTDNLSKFILKEDKKRAANLRQIRKRMRDKT